MGKDTTDALYFADYWKLTATGPSNVTLNDVIVNRSKNSVRFRGTLSTSDGENSENGTICIVNDAINYDHKIYTYGWTITDNIGTVVRRYASLGWQTSTTYYQDYKEVSEGVIQLNKIAYLTSNQSDKGIMVFLNAGTNVSFDFTISNIYLYEGSFVNPPREILSLDVNPNMTALYKDRLYQRQYNVCSGSTGATLGWQRLYHIPYQMVGLNTVVFFKGILQISKIYYHTRWSFIEVEFGVSSDDEHVFTLLEPTIYGGVSLTGGRPLFNKFRISKDTNGYFYLDGYHNVPYDDGIRMNLKDWVNFERDLHCYLYAISNNPTNETYIRNYLAITSSNFHYRETIPDDNITVVEKEVTLKMNS